MRNDQIVNKGGQKYANTATQSLHAKNPNLKSDIIRRSQHAGAPKLNPSSVKPTLNNNLQSNLNKPLVSSYKQPSNAIRNFDIATNNRRPASTTVRPAAQNQSAHPTPKNANQTDNNAVIAEALAKLEAEKSKGQSISKKRSKLARIITIIVAIVLILALGTYIYLSTPSLSVSLASAQAGINATYPEYKPDGYTLNRPIIHSNNQVEIKFLSNADNTYFVIKQQKSPWDSSAVKNQVNKDSKGEFITTEERGLTIYSYNGNASWVNGGILYTITGNAPLTSDQIRRIAASL